MGPGRMQQGRLFENVVTVKDVAAKADVSTATVSRVLSGKGGVSSELEQRVRSAIDELDYRPNQAARRLRERTAKIIGVLVPDIQIHFFASIVVSIERVLQEAGYLLLLGNTYDSLESEKQHIETFLSEDVSGVIFTPAVSPDIQNFKRLRDAGVPMIAIDRLPGDLRVDTVQVSNEKSTLNATLHLISEGHHRIGYIGGPKSISTAVDRQAGYECALTQLGIPLDQSLIQPGGYTIEGGYRAMRDLWKLNQRPTALLMANNSMTLGAMQFICENDISVPDQISIIGFDDMPWSTILRPPLTVITQPTTEIGVLAAQLMLARLNEPNSSIKHITLETHMVLRQSCLCSKKLPE